MLQGFLYVKQIGKLAGQNHVWIKLLSYFMPFQESEEE